MTSITQEACKEAGVKPRDAERSKNFFALGLVSWLYTRPVEPTVEWIAERFAARPQVAEANTRAFRAGYDFGETAELFESNYEVRPATFEKGEYVQVTGNQAMAWGLIAGARLAGLPLFLGSYPITPASDILHELSRRKEFGIRTFQAEDEIAGIGAALGASFGGALGVTTTSGPGLDLKSETIGLAINLELPLVIVDVQRGGPSTGLPTKTEQADLLHAMYGRHGEAPVPIVAPLHSQRLLRHRHRGDQDRREVPHAGDHALRRIPGQRGRALAPARPRRHRAPIDPDFAAEPNHVDEEGNETFWPYVRDPETLARPWAPPGLPGLEHRIGGLEKADGSGNVSYDGVNHERMVHLRRDKIAGIAADIPLVEVDDETGDAQLLLVELGIDLRRRGGRGQAGACPRHEGRPPPPPPPQPFPVQPGRGAAPVHPGTGARDQPGPAQPHPAGRVPRRRPDPLEDAGRSVPGRRDRGGHHGAARREVMSESNGANVTGRTATAVPVTTRKDWTSDQEVRWCPGCGDYSILAAVQMLMPDLGVRRENTVFLSGIGCAARFPYYMNTYGMHSIHGRAPAIATGLATTRPDLDVWVISGDGDSLSIGGNHLIHALRRNVRLNILMFNNQIYGLTKGQYSPTSEVAKVTKSTPFGSVDTPFNPVSLALGAEATFVARTHDMDRAHMQETFRRAHEHNGAAFVEVLQNCNVFNDGAFEKITSRDARSSMLIPLQHGQPIMFGAEGEERGVVQRPDGSLEIVAVADVGRRRLAGPRRGP